MSTVQESRTVSTPRPLPAHFSHAEQSFSLKKRRPAYSLSPARPLSRSLPPRPPSKGCPPLSRVFQPRCSPWRPLSRGLRRSPPPRSLYDPGRPRSFFCQCFVNLGLIGRGSFGEVYKVRSLLDGRLYAVKCSVQRFRGEAERGRSIREARNHERLPPHPHVLGFTAAWEEGGRLYIQTELCCTSLLLHAEVQPCSPGEPCAWDYLCDLLSALKHLHSQGFAHLDLKPANVFLTPSGRLKLGDFGLLLELPGGSTAGGAEDDRGAGQEEAQEGDPRYMAPELLRGEYGTAADIFSLGVSILELACNMEVPKGGEGWQQLRQGHLPSEFSDALSPELQRVLRLALTPEPARRPTAEQLLSLASVRTRWWRRRVSLRLRESWLSIRSLGQCVLAAGWIFLSSLRLPFLPSCPPPAPCTPPREREGDIGALQHSGVLSEADSPADAALQLSPSFSRRIQARTSGGHTSTPLQDRGGVDKASLAPPGHTPSPSRYLHLSPICGGSPARRTDPPVPSDSPASGCSSVHTEPEAVQRSGFEPRNLLSLFDETASLSDA